MKSFKIENLIVFFCVLSKIECIRRVQAIQNFYKALSDVPYNFLIGDDGNVYEGRGFTYQGEIVSKNFFDAYHESIIVAFIGNFSSKQPSEEQLESFNSFLSKSAAENKIMSNFALFSQNQLIDWTSDEFDQVLIKDPNFIPSELNLVETWI